MAWNGSGTFTRNNGENSGATTWADDAAAGTKITASNHDTHDEDIATAINACLTKNNETKPTAHFDPNAADTYDLGDATLTWRNLYASGDLVIKEQADHQVTPAAGFGQDWVKNRAPNVKMFTDDAGTDHVISPSLDTEVATTSGTTIDFTNAPAGCERFTVMLEETAHDGTSNLLIQLGDSGGFETSAYSSMSRYFDASPTHASTSSSSGFIINANGGTSGLFGAMTIILKDAANNTWVAQGNFAGGVSVNITCAGYKSLSAALTQVRITSVSGDTFDAGSANILWG